MTEQAKQIVAIDVGNSTTAVCLIQPSTLNFDRTWRVSSCADRPADEWRSLLMPLLEGAVSRTNAIVGAVIASVVPPATRSLTELVRDWFDVELVVVDARSDLGIEVVVDHPLEVGADRLVNAVGALHIFGAPSIIVDAGTATKIDVISARNEFLGGAIAPGIGIGLEALAARAARLYAVETVPPRRIIGRNTVEAVQSGLVLGHVAMVEGMIERVCIELGFAPPVIVTGGFGEILAGAMQLDTRLVPHLTLIGAACVWSREMVGA
ncbi:MAG: type III pantothenate kinase [Thermomicrobiales bacterium]